MAKSTVTVILLVDHVFLPRDPTKPGPQDAKPGRHGTNRGTGSIVRDAWHKTRSIAEKACEGSDQSSMKRVKVATGSRSVTRLFSILLSSA